MKNTPESMWRPAATTTPSRMALICNLLALCALLLLGQARAQVPDLTSGGVPGDTENMNLGPTGMEGWFYNGGSGKLNETGDSRQILVTKVDAGSPADGILSVGDVILGSDGTGAEPVDFTSDARKAFAYSINDAEGNTPAVLKLLRWRSGVTTSVSITLESIGSYTATAPYNDPKSAAILEKGIDYIMNNVTTTGGYGFSTTVLLAANDASNPNNTARQARAQAEAYQLNLSQADIDDMTSGDLSRSIGKPWSIGPQLITQAEYYLQTGDTAVLPSIRARAIMIANAQSLFGTMGHHYSLPGPNGEVNAPYGIGYGPVNNAGMPCFLGLILAEKCGLTDTEILDGIDRAGKYFQYYADLGTVPYGENKETGSISNNGKSALAAISLGMMNGYESQAKYFAKLSTFGADERDSGHTGPYFNQLWTPLGSNFGGQDSLVRYFNQTSWLYDLCRRWDGSFVYQNYYQSGGIRSYGSDHRMSTATLLTYAAPLAKLYITGKNLNPSLVLDATDMAAIDHAIGYDPTTRTTAELIEDLKSPLPQLHWSAGNEIGNNRSADHASILPTIIDMAQNGATYAEQHGAIYALNKIADDSTASVLSGLCASPNSKVRYMAANALSNLSMAAKTAEVANIVNGLVANDRPLLPLDPENPMHVEKMSFATLLFDSNVGIWGGSRVITADRNLFYPAFRIIATAAMGVTVRDKAFSVAPYLTKADVEELADVMVEVVSGPPPAEISYACRAGAIEAMQVNHFAEGVPAAVIAFFDMTKNNHLVLEQLENYAASSLTVQPDPQIIEFCKRLVSNEDPYFFGAKYDDDAQAILDAIAADQLPVQLTPFKSIDWIFADRSSLSLPTTSTVLRVQSTDLAKGTPYFTWRKVHGAGGVSFTPNGTAAAKDTTVVFDGTPGVYTFEVTMADDKGLTEAYGTVTVTLNDTGGSLPPNTAPTAYLDAITAGQGAPTQLLLTGSDPEGQELIYNVTEGPSKGYLSGTAPNLVYTSDLAYTGADSITFEVMDTEGLVSGSATVNITVNPVADVGLAIYEPFDYPSGAFNGSSSVNEIGLAGSWTAQANMDVIGGSLNYGSLVTNGGALTASNSANSHAASRAINPVALAENGLLNDGSTLWFSAVLGHPGMVSSMYMALANDQFSNSATNHYIVNDGAQLGSGMGVWVDGANVYATHFQDSAQGGGNAGTWTSDYGSIKSGVQRLVVGKITWGAASDTIEIYLPWNDLALPSAPSSTLTVNVDQSTYDTLTISRNGTPLIDEIRFGSNYQSVIQGTTPMVPDTTAPTPDPMTFAAAPAPGSSSSITMTATPAFDLNEVEYYFTCSVGGGNDSGWQDSNVYTDAGLTPGVQYSYTVKARDKQPTHNETVASAVASATIPVQGTVPNLVGILQSSAESLVVVADLTVGNITTASGFNLTVPAGHVMSQTPAAGTIAAYGSTVDLEISIGQDPALPTLAAVDIVDDQSGGPVVVNTPMTYTLTFSEDIDAATLDTADFVNVGSAAVTIGTITETSPGVVTVGVTPTSAGILRFAVAEGAAIQDSQSDALNTATAIIDDTVITINLPDELVPDVTGLAQATAESTITAANLVVGTVNSIYDELVPAGDVISQDPVGGSSIPGQSKVGLVVSLGTPPDTTGPVIVSHVPVDAGFNVEVDAELKITFDEEVFIGVGNIILRNLNEGTDMIISVTDPAQALAYVNTLTITPAVNLDAGKSYAVRVPAGAVVDASGNGFLGINNDYAWNFSTAVTSLSSVLFAEDFEAPDVVAYSEGTSPANWVRASQGFGATKHGLTDKAGGDFIALDPNHQAYAFRYSNSGLTTAEGVVGTIAEGVTYRVEFDVVRDDGGNAGTPYDVRMWAFSPGDARTDCSGLGDGTQLAITIGNATADGNFSTVFFEYTVPVGSPDVGKDFAVRLKGASTSATVDNVVVRTVSPSAADQVAPAIAQLTPADDAQNVSLVDNLKIIFDEDIAVGAGLITIKDLTTGAVTVINAIDGSQVLLTGDTLEINPTQDFNTNTFYSVQIETGTIADLAGNGFAGITDDISWTFNTGETSDGAAPGIFALSPVDGATGVSYRSSLTLTMDENVVVNAGNITLKNLTDVTEVVIDVTDSSQVAAAGQDVTITPASYLGEGKDYAVQINAGAILDLSGNAFAGLADDVTWNFTTSATNPPAIAALDPIDEAVNVDVAANLSVTFDEDIAASTGNITLRNVVTSGDLLIDVNDATQVTISGPTLTVNPLGDLAEAANYAILIDNGAVQDLAGNPFGGITSDATWNFVTGVSQVGLAFSDDFEVSSGSPDVNAAGSAGYTSQQTGPNWVRAAQGFGAGNHGIVDESSNQFTDPGGEQAYAFRYSNSGLTTAQSVIGTLAAGKVYRVTFNVVGDAVNAGGPYSCGLVSFAPAAARDDTRTMGAGASMVLASKSGNYTGTAYQLVSFEYISDGVSDAAAQGHDLAIRFQGAITSANIDNVQITINDAPNDVVPPTLASSGIVDDKAGAPVDVGTLVTYNVTFSEDMDAASVTAADFSNAGTAAVTIGSVSETVPGVFSVQATPTTAGSLQLQVSASAVLSDVAGNSLDTATAIVDDTTITVNAINSAPVWATNPVNEVNATRDLAYSSTLADNASDFDSDPLAFAKVGGPAWLSVAANGDLSGIPSVGDIGLNAFTVSVSDGIAAPVVATLNITVINPNSVPVFTSNPFSAVDATEDAAYASTIAGSATDGDSDPLAYAKVSGPAWLVVAGDGTLSGTPANGDVGVNAFTVSVTDGIAAPVQATLNITVINTNDAPVFSANPIAGVDATENAVYSGTLVGSASDADGNTLTYAKVSGPAWLTVATNGALSGIPANGDIGANVFTVSVSDSIAPAVEATLNITVNAAPPAGMVFADNFEPGANTYGGTTQDVSSYTLGNTSKQTNTTLWVRSTGGYGSDRSGLVDETENGGLNFTDPAGTQAYGMRYTNTALTTTEGLLGALTPSTTIDVSFDVVKDGFNTGLAYDAMLVLFDTGASRNLVEFAEKGTAAVLARATGNVAADGNYYTVSFSYVVGDPVVDNDGAGAGFNTTWLASLLGKDIGLRFKGVTTSANIDNVQVSVSGGGPTMVTVPNVIGLDQVTAESNIVATNLLVGTVTGQNDAVVPVGDVISQNPVGSTSVAEGSNVDLVVSLGPVMTTVPNVVGLAQATAESNIVAANLLVGTITSQNDATVPAGDVISQSLTAGASVAENTAVDLVVSLGPVMTTVPNVVGLAQATAEADIVTANLLVGTITSQNDATVPSGDVIGQSLTAGASVAENTAVDLVVSLGPVMTTVPNVVGLAQATAEADIVTANLLVGTITSQNDATVPAGDVISQSLTAGASVAENTAVDLVVSLGPVMTTVPNVVGLAQATAESNIVAANLLVGTITSQNDATVPAGDVISQSLTAGASVAENTAVDLVVSLGPVMTTVPNVVGLAQATAEADIVTANLLVGTITSQNDATVPAGDVISQSLTAGASVAENTAVDLVVSLGPVMTTVPNVVGLAQATAEADIVTANLLVGTITSQNDATVPSGDVISQSLTAGASVAENTAVDLVVSLGPVMTTVPNVVGLAQATAEADIVAANLVVGTITSQNDATVPEGDVISQSLTAGASVAENTSVDLVVSLGPVMTTVPNVVGLAQATAEANIVAASLVVGTVTSQNSATVPTGNVISQTPSGGASVAENTSVDLVISLGSAPSAKLVRTTVAGISNAAWTTIDLGGTYTSPVIVATPIYAPGVSIPVVTRINNITATGFDLKLDRADGSTAAVSMNVSVVAVEEGVYTQANDGVTMEAVIYTSTITASGPNAWYGEARSYQNSYTAPVVIGQVMSYNDTKWSAFWSMGASRQDAVDASNLNVGKHVGQDSNSSRANESIGYIVIESGSGTIDGIAYEAGLGPATVQSFGDSSSPFSYSLSGGLSSVSTAAVSQSGMSGNDGAWAVLSGSPYVTTTSLSLHVSEDSFKDSRQRHSAERVAYIVFE